MYTEANTCLYMDRWVYTRRQTRLLASDLYCTYVRTCTYMKGSPQNSTEDGRNLEVLSHVLYQNRLKSRVVQYHFSTIGLDLLCTCIIYTCMYMYTHDVHRTHAHTCTYVHVHMHVRIICIHVYYRHVHMQYMCSYMHAL